MAFRRNRLYKRKRSYNRVRKYNSSRRYKRTKNSLNYKVYALTRKVNRYISTYKPEIQQVRGRWIYENFKANDGQGAFEPTHRGYRNLYETALNVYSVNPAPLLEIKSDLCRSFKLRLFGYFGLCPTHKIYENDPDSDDYSVNDPYPQTCYLKLVIATLKKGGGRIPTSGEVFVSNQPAPQIPGFDDLALITGPLNKGITSQLSILRTKVVKIDHTTPHKLFKINLKVPHYRKRVNNNAYGAGEILLYYQLLCPTYLTGGQPTPDPRFVLDYQLLYVDQN